MKSLSTGLQKCNVTISDYSVNDRLILFDRSFKQSRGRDGYKVMRDKMDEISFTKPPF